MLPHNITHQMLNIQPTFGGHEVDVLCPVHGAEKRCHT